MPAPAHQRTPQIVYGLIALGVVGRLVPHPPNSTPLAAIALFSGTYLGRRWAILAPLAAVAISDLLLGWHATVPFTWGAFALTGWLSWWVRRAPTASRITAAAVAGSLLFFVVTNFGVWVVGGLYPRTAAGLWECYVAALPFLRGSFAGDLLYTAALFGGYAWATSRRHGRLPA